MIFVNVPIKRLDDTPVVLPTYAHLDDAGADLRASHGANIPPRQSVMVGTSWAIKIPDGYVGMVCSRSGLAGKSNVFVLNAPGIIDSGYTGELLVILYNAGHQDFVVHAGDRIAQLVIVPFVTAVFNEVYNLSEDTSRGSSGFGSTGVSS